MALPAIITIDDVREIRPITANTNQDHIEPYIIEAQEQELKQLLGQSFYFAFVTDLEGGGSPENELLFDGGEYENGNQTWNFRGVKEFLSFAAFARYVIRNNQQVTRFGVVTKVVEESTAVSTAMANQERSDARAVQMSVQREITEFLEANPTDYPLFRERSTTPTKQSFKFSKIERRIRP